MNKFEYTDLDGDRMEVAEAFEIRKGMLTISRPEEEYEEDEQANAFIVLDKEAAIRLGRWLLNFFGAPLEGPKPEPKAGQVWQSEWGKMKCIVVRIEGGISLLAHENGAWSNADKAILHANYKFVSESWAEEKTE